MSSDYSGDAGSLANTIRRALLGAMLSLALALPAAATGTEPSPEMQADMSYKDMAGMMGMDDAAAFGKVMLDRGIGGFREDRTNPLRPLAAALFPNDQDIVRAIGIERIVPRPAF